MRAFYPEVQAWPREPERSWSLTGPPGSPTFAAIDAPRSYSREGRPPCVPAASS